MILAAVVLTVVILFKLPGQTVGRLKLALVGGFLPLFGLTGAAHQAASQASNGLLSRRELTAENDDLRRQNEQLQLRLEQEVEVQRENSQLRALVGWARRAGWKVKLARVVARDPANWWRSIQIDLGRRDGLLPNLAVMTAAGLVGKVENVGAARSQVILLGDPELRVAARVEQTGETGVIVSGASSPQEDNMVDIAYLSGISGVSPGQDVCTSGVGGVFSNGIPIGKIVDQWKQENGLTTEARVRLAANLGSLEEVWVMMP